MDQQSGRFVPEEKATPGMPRVEMLEVLELDGVKLQIVRIGDRRMTLQLMSQAEIEALTFEIRAHPDREISRHDILEQKPSQGELARRCKLEAQQNRKRGQPGGDRC